MLRENKIKHAKTYTRLKLDIPAIGKRQRHIPMSLTARLINSILVGVLNALYIENMDRTMPFPKTPNSPVNKQKIIRNEK